MKKIIVPVDFSEYSENALKTGAYFAKKYNADLLVLHMLDIPSISINKSGAYLQQETGFFIELAKSNFEDFLNKDYLKGINVSTIIKHYKLFDEINRIAKIENVDLIVMGSKGVSGLKGFFIGSNTEKVVRNSEIPVLVTKEQPILADFKTGFFATNFSIDEVPTYRKIKKFFNSLDIKLNLLHVNTPTKSFKSSGEIERDAVQFLNKVDGNLDALRDVNYVADYTIEQGIINFANVSGSDLIAMATHGRRGISHLFEGSISEDVANRSTLPVITFKM